MSLTLLAKALHQWRGFATGSVNSRIFHAMTIIAALTFVVKMAAVAKDVVVAGHFGMGDELDAFFLALTVPMFAAMVLAQSFQGAFMPTYIRVREDEGPVAASKLFANVIVINFCILLVCSLLLAAAANPVVNLVTSELSEQKRSLVRHLYFLLLPLIVLEGQLTLWGAVLNAGEKFALVALSPMLVSLIIVGLLVLGGQRANINLLVWGTLAGYVAELAVIGFVLARRGLLPVVRWYRAIRPVSDVFRQYVPLVLAAVMVCSAPVVDQVMASWLGSGSVAALTYGNKIPSFLAGIGVTALGTAVLPQFSRLVALGDHAALRHTFNTYTRWILIISIPVTLLFIGASEWIVRLVFERGAFHSEDTALVARIQQMYLLQVPFLILGVFGVRILVAMAKNHLLTIMAVVNFTVNVVGNLIFMRWLGVAGIALSTSIVYMVSMSMILVLLNRNLAQMAARTGKAL